MERGGWSHCIPGDSAQAPLVPQDAIPPVPHLFDSALSSERRNLQSLGVCGLRHSVAKSGAKDSQNPEFQSSRVSLRPLGGWREKKSHNAPTNEPDPAGNELHMYLYFKLLIHTLHTLPHYLSLWNHGSPLLYHPLRNAFINIRLLFDVLFRACQVRGLYQDGKR